MAPTAVVHANSSEFEALKRELTRDARFSRLTNVSMDPARGVLRLRLAGDVSSEADRAYAGRLASSVPGVAYIYNEIQVHSPSAFTRAQGAAGSAGARPPRGRPAAAASTSSTTRTRSTP